MPIEVVFFGTPEFAVPALQALAADRSYLVTGVVTQPDKPAGRGQKLQQQPVKLKALELGLPVFQPASLKSLQLAERDAAESAENRGLLSALASRNQKVLVVVAYGKIIPDALLNLTPCGVVNIHPSLLPRWRGAAPIQRALFAGDAETGVCLMRLESGLDTGPVFVRSEMRVLDSDDYGSLHDKLAALGAEMLARNLSAVVSGDLPAQPQSEDGVTYAEKWEADDLRIRWEEPADTTLRRIRACSPYPGARTGPGTAPVKIFSASISEKAPPGAEPGTIIVRGESAAVCCGDNRLLEIRSLQFAGKKRIIAAEAVRGRLLEDGMKFG